MSLQLRPLSPHLGVEIIGLDLNQPIDAATAEEICAAFRDHHLLLLRQPGVTEQAQIDFTRIFGTLLVRNTYDGSRGKEAHYISNNRPDGVLPVGEIQFHHDQIFYARPLRVGVLYGIEIPASGSATRFRSAAALTDRLPPDLRVRAEGVRCLHFFSYAEDDYAAKQDVSKANERSQQAWQPLIWTDPETRRKAPWIAPITTVDYEGVSKTEGDALVDRLWKQAEANADLAYTHQWRTGDMIVWDNHMAAHARLPFQSSEARTLRRTSAI